MNGGGEAEERSLWEEAVMAASLFAVDPVGLGGIAVASKYGPVRDSWMDFLRSIVPGWAPFRKLPLYAADERLFGGLDLAATLAHGKPVAERGLLAEMDRGFLVIPSAERMESGLASRLGLVIDAHAVHVEREAASMMHPARFGVIALDESEAGDDETPPAALLERLGLRIDLTDVTWRDVCLSDTTLEEIEAAQARLPNVAVPDKIIAGLVSAAVSFGIQTLRAPVFAVRAARASAALAGRDEANEEDAGLAAMLVLAPRATRMPEPMEDQAPPEPPPPEPQDDKEEDGKGGGESGENETAPDDDKALTDMIIAAAAAAMPKEMLVKAAAKPFRVPPSAPMGKAGAERTNAARGRPAGVRRGMPKPGSPLSLLETLRAAAPWQKIRKSMLEKAANTGRIDRIEVRSDDFRIKRLKARSQTATIFAVDASGSAAMQRLAETKGAVELLLAECYIRRDQVALVAFRGTRAEILLPPTRSLTRAKRSLAALAGGGGTPLASGIDAAGALAINIRRRGISPLIVVLTDGKANIAADGKPGRERAQNDANTAGRRLRAEGIATILVDTSPRPQAQAEKLAQEMAARYVPMPYANAAAISKAAKMAAKG
ncbi:magnesium chelatase subunit D [Rhodomicrobium sp. Az07]|uniref:magnesium chelatase subunit D n=1 Tax=Rhodomicrobium sp. Az07 TaxID=2839034 RepID=UPI001BEBE4EA|nr:magnesium chelatase subunit D [Rhodomicrobium sp. Az07]MBT3070280.1 magnesium chelatase subunit D [Rhodomicrobium sp. Az07]